MEECFVVPAWETDIVQFELHIVAVIWGLWLNSVQFQNHSDLHSMASNQWPAWDLGGPVCPKGPGGTPFTPRQKAFCPVHLSGLGAVQEIKCRCGKKDASCHSCNRPPTVAPAPVPRTAHPSGPVCRCTQGNMGPAWKKPELVVWEHPS